MSTMLETLEEQRVAADKAFEDYASPLISENRALTDEENTKLEELRSRRNEITGRIAEIEKDAAILSEVIEARKNKGTAQASITVNSEPRTYGPGSDRSYFLDLCRAASPGIAGYDDAVLHLNKHAREVAGEMRDPKSKEGKRARRVIANTNRSEDSRQARNAVDRAAHFAEGIELRTGMDTTSASGGSFVTPQYFVSKYAPYRQFNRVFADAANKMPLPDYGMTIYLPQVTAAAGIAAQVSQNSGIQETDPTAAYLSTNLTTNAGQVTVSQQLLDRAGPNFQFDVMVFDQLQRAYDSTLDTYVLTQALANAGTVTYTTPALTGSASLFSLIGKAKAATVDAAGVVLPATHCFMQPVNFEWSAAQVDSQNRPLWVPSYAGAFNAAAAGSAGKPIADGDTGYRIGGLPVFEDGNIPLHSTNNQAIVADMAEVWYWEGDLVNRTVPQTVAQNLSVLLQAYAYVGCIVRYPLAVQALQGAGLPTSPSF